MTHNEQGLAMVWNLKYVSPNRCTVNEQKDKIMIHSSTENVKPEPQPNSELEADNKHVSKSIANAHVGRSAEYILCSAIWIDDGVTTYVHQPKNIKQGFVVAGRRHHNCITTLAMLQGVRKERRNKANISESG